FLLFIGRINQGDAVRSGQFFHASLQALPKLPSVSIDTAYSVVRTSINAQASPKFCRHSIPFKMGTGFPPPRAWPGGWRSVIGSGMGISGARFAKSGRFGPVAQLDRAAVS